MADVFKAASEERALQRGELPPTYKHMCALAASGLKPAEIAEVAGYKSVEHVRDILNLPQSKMLIERLASDLVDHLTMDTAVRIQAHASEALTTVVDLMRNSKNERIKQISAFDILDRAGFKPKEVHVTAKMEMPAAEAQVISQTLREMNQEVIDRPNMDNAIEVFGKKVGGRNLGEQ